MCDLTVSTYFLVSSLCPPRHSQEHVFDLSDIIDEVKQSLVVGIVVCGILELQRRSPSMSLKIIAEIDLFERSNMFDRTL